MESTSIQNLENSVKNKHGEVCAIIRTFSAGVHIGFVQEKTITVAGIHVVLRDSKRIWSWSGANSLSQLALNGSTKRNDCRISVPVSYNEMIAIEVIPVTNESFANIYNGKEWKL